MRERLTFLFWNLGRRSLAKEVALAIQEHKVDIVVLAESDTTISALRVWFPAINEPVSYTDRIQIYTRGDPAQIVPFFDDAAKRLTIRRLNLPGCPEILLAAVHFYDKRNWTDDEQWVEVIALSADIVRAEDSRGHTRTLLVGDFNMNPFAKAVVGAAGLHGVMTKDIARRRSRIVAARQYRFFYNPMWSLFGDNAVAPAGTHFYSKSTQIAFFWYMFDQVLVRPDLMDSLLSLRILDQIDGRSLLDGLGRPSISDHLPLLFELDLRRAI